MKQRVRLAIDELADNPRPAGCRKLTEFNAWRVRVGDYRILPEIQDDKLIVTVISLGHRREVYR